MLLCQETKPKEKMCKFSNHLFVYTLLCLLLNLQWTKATPVYRHQESPRLLSELLEQDYDYDLHYDQRQKGSENLRLKLDGFLIGLPAQQDSLGLALVTDDILENLAAEVLLGLSKSGSTTSAPDNSLNFYNKLEHAAPSKQESAFNAETIVVEIPAPKKDRDFESRQHIDSTTANIGSRTKFHIFHLLNFLRGNKRF